MVTAVYDGDFLNSVSSSHLALPSDGPTVLERMLNLHRFYELTVIGTGPSGLAGASGLLLDGAGDGSPGSDYVTSITGRDLVKTNAIGAELREDRAMARVSQIARLRLRQR
jgi:hypothetical protein